MHHHDYDPPDNNDPSRYNNDPSRYNNGSSHYDDHSPDYDNHAPHHDDDPAHDHFVQYDHHGGLRLHDDHY